MTVLSERINHLVKTLSDGKALRFARKFGFPQSSISYWVKGEQKPSADQLSKIITTTKCSAHWLLTGEGEPFPPPVAPAIHIAGSSSPHLVANIPLAAGDFVSVPVLKTGAIVRQPLAVHESDVLDYVVVFHKFAVAGRHYAVRMPANSMHPLIQKNDLVGINTKNTSPQSLSGRIVAVQHNDNLRIGILSLTDDVATLLFFNTAHPPVSLSARLSVIGAVEWSTTDLRQYQHFQLSK